MHNTSSLGKAITQKQTFSRTTSISQLIDAPPQVVWQILTDASQFARWNSTIVSLEGEIKLGATLKLRTTLDPSRTFRLKVKEMIPTQGLTWGDAMGKRSYTLTAHDQQTLFSMTEKIGGLFFPLFARKIPSFDESFEQFTTDLKKEAEVRHQK